MALDVKEALAKGRTVYTPNPDGTVTFETPGGETWTVGNTAEVAANATTGAALLAELRARRGSLIEPFECGGITWYLLKMDYPTHNLVAELTARHGDGSMRLDHPPVMRAFVRAVVQCGTVKGEKDLEQFFNPHPQVIPDAAGNPVTTTEIEQFMAEPEAVEIIAALFDRLTDINPSLWKEKKRMMELAAQIMNGEMTPPTQTSASPG